VPSQVNRNGVRSIEASCCWRTVLLAYDGICEGDWAGFSVGEVAWF
jgi:hypothetical protein